MEYLGTYQSNLSVWHNQELTKLLKAAFEQGDYSAGKTFDQTALLKLRADALDFGSMPTATVGQRVTDDSLNRPMDLLRARFQALLSETAQFDQRCAALLVLLQKDSVLVDQLLFAAALDKWQSIQPDLGSGQDIKWDFGMGYGPVGAEIDSIDPANGVIYNSRPPIASFLLDTIRTGLASSSQVRHVAVKAMSWSYQSSGEVEELYGDDWTKLSLLESKPLVVYSGVPAVSPAVNPYLVTGSSLLGSVPVFVRTQFTQRRNQACKTYPVAGVLDGLTSYQISSGDVVVRRISDQRLLTAFVDYSVDDNGTFTPLAPMLNIPVQLFWLEYFPSYQCSINQVDWSPLRMFDASRPYLDSERDFQIIPFGPAADGTRSALPITDELGNATGLYIQLGPNPTSTEWLIEINNPASSDTVGATAILDVELARPSYLNALQLAPFTTFPLTLKQITTVGMTNDTAKVVWSGKVVLDRATSLCFDRTLVRHVILTFYQENYALKEHDVFSADALRREVMSGLQTALPFAVRRSAPALPVRKVGAQYEFGVETIEGQDWTAVPGVFISGPHRLTGCPEVLRLDAEISGQVDSYLLYRAYDASGVVVDTSLSTAGMAVQYNTAIIFPFAETLARNLVDHVDIYLKMVHRGDQALIERFLLQVSNV